MLLANVGCVFSEAIIERRPLISTLRCTNDKFWQYVWTSLKSFRSELNVPLTKSKLYLAMIHYRCPRIHRFRSVLIIVVTPTLPCVMMQSLAINNQDVLWMINHQTKKLLSEHPVNFLDFYFVLEYPLIESYFFPSTFSDLPSRRFRPWPFRPINQLTYQIHCKLVIVWAQFRRIRH